MIYDIVQVVPFEDYTVYVYFEDGKIVCYDAKPLLDKKVFEPLRDKDFFLNSCTILNGTLAWDVTGTRDTSKCLDIDPDTLYELENVKDKISDKNATNKKINSKINRKTIEEKNGNTYSQIICTGFWWLAG